MSQENYRSQQEINNLCKEAEEKMRIPKVKVPGCECSMEIIQYEWCGDGLLHDTIRCKNDTHQDLPPIVRLKKMPGLPCPQPACKEAFRRTGGHKNKQEAI